MAKTIWKYPLGKTGSAAGYVEIKMPKGATVLSVANQYNTTTVYALVDDAIDETEIHTFDVYLTGNIIDCDESFTFLGTVVLNDGNYVYHVFYKKP